MAALLDDLGAAFLEKRPPPLGPLPEGFAVILVDASRQAPPLSPAAILWLHARLRANGWHEGAQNFGALRCCLPHAHGGADGLCLEARPGLYLRRYESAEDALARLLIVAHFATLGGDVAPLEPALEPAHGVGGYRSLQPTQEQIEAATTGEGVAGVGGFFDAINPFAPSGELERRIQEAAATWTGLEEKIAKDPKLAKVLKPTHDHWLAFWSKWKAGDRDQADANAIISEANMARAEALKVFVQDLPNAIQNVPLEKQSAAKGGAVAADEAATGLGIKPGQEWKILAGVGGALAVLLAAILGRR